MPKKKASKKIGSRNASKKASKKTNLVRSVKDKPLAVIQPIIEIDLEVSDSNSSESSDSIDSKILEAAQVVRRDGIGTVFDLDGIEDPLIGSPAEVQRELDNLALKLQRRPSNQDAFLRIVAYMHKYILGLVFKKYSFIKGYEVYDIYQEALIALFKKAVPSFRKGKGMSFLNFAKMCINRHLITILHASRTRRKDIPMNTAISLDHNPAGHPDDDDSCPLSNVITNAECHEAPYEEICRTEAFSETLGSLREKLSHFECIVLEEYLESKSYRLAARAIRRKYGEPCNEKSIDNALLRIRKKADELKNEENDNDDSLPLLK